MGSVTLSGAVMGRDLRVYPCRGTAFQVPAEPLSTQHSKTPIIYIMSSSSKHAAAVGVPMAGYAGARLTPLGS